MSYVYLVLTIASAAGTIFVVPMVGFTVLFAAFYVSEIVEERFGELAGKSGAAKDRDPVPEEAE